MWPGRVWNPGPLTYESGALLTALRGPAINLLCGTMTTLTIYSFRCQVNREAMVAAVPAKPEPTMKTKATSVTRTIRSTRDIPRDTPGRVPKLIWTTMGIS